MNAQIALVSPAGLVTAVTRGVAEIRALVDRGDGGGPVSASAWVVVSERAPQLALTGGQPGDDREPDQEPDVDPGTIVIGPEVDSLPVADSLSSGITTETVPEDSASVQDVSLADGDVPPVDSISPGVTDIVTEPPAPEPPDDLPPDPNPEVEFRSNVDVPPQLQNREEIEEAMDEQYPPPLRATGTPATVQILFSVYATGEIADFEIVQRSGFSQVDDLAELLAGEMEFSPAMLDGQPVPAFYLHPFNFRP